MQDIHKKKIKHKKMGVVGTATLLLILLKIANVISWPWVWVLSPIWISGIIAVFAFGVILVGGRIVKGKW